MGRRSYSGWLIVAVLLISIVTAIQFFGAVVGDWLKALHGGGGH